MSSLDELSSFTSSKRCNQVLHDLIQDRWTLKDACQAISEKTDRSPASLKKYYQRHGKDQHKAHGLNKLTKEEEDILVSIIMVYLTFHEGLTCQEVVELAKDLYEVELGRQWYTCLHEKAQ